MILAKTMPIVSTAAIMQPGHWNAEREGPVAQQRKVESIAAKGHKNGARPATIHREAFNKAEQQFGLALLGHRSAADLGNRPRAAPSSRLA